MNSGYVMQVACPISGGTKEAKNMLFTFTEMKCDSCFTPCTKITSRWTKGLYVKKKKKMLRYLTETVDEYLVDFSGRERSLK